MNETHISNANNRSIHVNGFIDLFVNREVSLENVGLNVLERLTREAILRGDYCDKHVESILDMKRVVKLAHVTTVPIIRKPTPNTKDEIPIPAKQEKELSKIHTSKTSPWLLQR